MIPLGILGYLILPVDLLPDVFQVSDGSTIW
ncbi:MAG TPA: DUF1232 domain-containing protein [Candidatus Acidoferrum sp.]|nr:DUF1232 domain-containing protein [Candidatus Acidoferrum sp.]